jgi:thioredoxin reductase (NADPH)
VAHAELGERIVRALILRRVGLIEQASGGPVIVGPRGHGRIHTLQTFLQANGHPHMVLDPEHDQQAADLMAHYQPRAEELPLVVCPDGVVKKNPAWSISAAASACCPARYRQGVGRDRGRRRSGRAGDGRVCGLGRLVGAGAGNPRLRRPGWRQCAHRKLPRLPDRHSGRALAGRAYVQAQKFGVEIAIPAPAGRLLCDTYPLQVEMCGSLQR